MLARREVITAHQPTTPPPTRPRPAGVRRLLPLIPVPLLAAAIWWVLAFNPTDTIMDPTGPCLWHALSGINGPSCGGTRMFYHLIHGNLIQAARHHLAALVAMLVAGYYWTAWTGRWMFGLRIPMPRIRQWQIIAFLIFFFAYSTVLRNLPWEPFIWFNIPDLTPAGR